MRIFLASVTLTHLLIHSSISYDHRRLTRHGHIVQKWISLSFFRGTELICHMPQQVPDETRLHNQNRYVNNKFCVQSTPTRSQYDQYQRLWCAI